MPYRLNPAAALGGAPAPALPPAPRTLTLANGHRVECLGRGVLWAPFVMPAGGAELVICAAVTSRGELLSSWQPIPADSPADVLDALWDSMQALLDRVDPLPAPRLRIVG